MSLKKLNPEQLKAVAEDELSKFTAMFLAYHGSRTERTKEVNKFDFSMELLDKKRLGIMPVPQHDLSRKLKTPNGDFISFQFDIRTSGMLSKLNRLDSFTSREASSLNNTVTESYKRILTERLEGSILEIEGEPTLFECAVKANIQTCKTLRKLTSQYEEYALKNSSYLQKIEKKPRIQRKPNRDSDDFTKDIEITPGPGKRGGYDISL